MLEKISDGLPADLWRRYHELKEKRDDVTLTPQEYSELIRLSDAIEEWNVRRLQWVAELSRLRGVPFQELVQQLGLYPSADG